MANKYGVLGWAAVAVCLLGCGTARAEKSRTKALSGSRPNIVLVVTDDNSFDTVGRYGGGAASPHLDRLYDCYVPKCWV
jgi:hypothetical protein